MVNNIVAVPCDSDKGLHANVVSRFGRCPFFTIISLESEEIKEVTIVENPGINAMGGAGPLAAQTIAQENVKVVIGGNYGPNAASALSQGQINCFGYAPTTEILTVEQILQEYLNQKLPKIEGANVDSHFGMRGMGGGGGGGRGGGRGTGRGGRD